MTQHRLFEEEKKIITVTRFSFIRLACRDTDLRHSWDNTPGTKNVSLAKDFSCAANPNIQP